MGTKDRTLYVLKYLWENTDEEHPATTNEIIEHLSVLGIDTTRKTVTEDIVGLQECGVDIVCNRSRQNEYFIGARHLELAELKLLVDAVQAARFISGKKSRELIEKRSALAGPHQSEELRRKLFVDGKIKTDNEKVFYAVDTLYAAIREQRTVCFKYIEYTAEKKKVFKHRGQKYVLSPYDMVWCNDSYYVFGWSESHGKVAKFRVDRMHLPAAADMPFRVRPEDYDITAFCRRVFSMYDGKTQSVELKCGNSLMKAVIDRFGEEVSVRSTGGGCFIASVEVSVSPTFYAWVFTYSGKIKILSPQTVRDEYENRLKTALNQEIQ